VVLVGDIQNVISEDDMTKDTQIVSDGEGLEITAKNPNKKR
jgi:hypothetical protein